MCDYKNGIIYKIVCEITGEVYIGSTKQSLEDRIIFHIREYNNTCSKQIIDRNKYYIEHLETYPCNSKQELCRREGEYQLMFECINTKIAGRTHAEWRIDNKERITKQKSEYYLDNKEKLSQQHREYRLEHSEKIAKQKSEYRQDNKEYLKECDKQYRLKNKEKIKAKSREVVICECGLKSTRCHLSTHKRSKKHIDLMSNLNQPSSDPLVAEMPEQNQVGRISNH